MSSVPSLLSRPYARFRRGARPGHDRWNTWDPPKAEVLGVARTLTSATRLVDVMHLLRTEDGIEKFFTVNPGSAFADGLGLLSHRARRPGAELEGGHPALLRPGGQLARCTRRCAGSTPR